MPSAQHLLRHTGDGTLSYSSPHIPSRVLSQVGLSGQCENEKKMKKNKPKQSRTKLHFDCFLIMQSFIPSCLSERAAAAGDEVLSPRAVLPQDFWGYTWTGAAPFPWPVGHGDSTHSGVGHWSLPQLPPAPLLSCLVLGSFRACGQCFWQAA